ncbi:MAG: hypothetical protein AMS26_02085 [Bacteroides sp. SM23_62]|nr:MAG: hypothetical protein AMS26_02085 [Bacteroides sp. SM23_62]
MKYSIQTALMVILTILATSCKVKYSFSGANTGVLETVSIDFFQNRSALAPPALGQYITEEFRDLCERQTNLTLITGPGDAHFEGEITVYSTRAMAISGDDRAALTRFTIGVKITYTNNLDPDLSFEETFSQYRDYESSLQFESVRSELTDAIVEEINEDIFNRAFVNW